jgi:hypothetical protein
LAQSLDLPTRALLTVLRGNRTRISFTYLAKFAGIPQRQLNRYKQMRPVRDAMAKYGWTLTDSKALGLPALECFPYSVPFLVRNAHQQ